MKLAICALALVMAAPAAVRSQGPRGPSDIDTKAVLEKMESSVARIAGPLEKMRWQANVTLWQVRLSHTGKLTAAELQKMQTSFDSMKVNVANITEPGERERWQTNRDLWKLMLAQGDKIASADREKMQPLFDRMEANIAKITSVFEKARWQANRDLWQAMLTQK